MVQRFVSRVDESNAKTYVESAIIDASLIDASIVDAIFGASRAQLRTH